jgi:release factor glutamine methyltransferase
MLAAGNSRQIEEHTEERWTVLSVLEWSTRYLQARGFDEARLHVELLLSHVLGLSRIELYTKFDRPLISEELHRFKILLQRRLAREPLQYILGETEFMGLRLFVAPGVLIPRPETEILVEKTLETIRTIGRSDVDILDIGTGSGNIAIALASFVPEARVTAIDKSVDALSVAKKNVVRHTVTNVTLQEADVLSDIFPGRKFDVIVSNPPYISREEIVSLAPEIREHEPRVATCDESDGFRFLTRIAQLAPVKLKQGGYLLLEVGFGQSEQVRKLLKQSGLTNIEVFNDYARVPRVMKAQLPLERMSET